MMIKTKRLTIRRATEDDAETFARWWADGKHMEHAGFPRGITTDIEALKKRLRASNPDNQLCVIESETHQPIGELSAYRKGSGMMIGIKLVGPTHQNKGLGTEALQAFITWLFEHHAIDHLALDTMIENTRAQAVYERLGFVKQGINKDCWTDQLGRLRTAVDYRLTRQRYQSLPWVRAHAQPNS